MPELAPLSGLARLPYYPWLVVATVSFGNLVGTTDASIVQLAMPTFEDAFDAPIGAVSWIAIAYVLAFVATLPTFARLAELEGRKTLYLIGFALFGVFSAACALAPNLASLIAFRALLGVGGANMGANSVVVIVSAAGAERRGRALGIQAAAQAVGLGAGPALGGVLLGLFGWRSIFWVAVPAAALGTLIGWLVIPTTKPTQAGRFDVVGAVLLAPALAALLLAITQARAWGFTVPMLACLVVAPTLLPPLPGGRSGRPSRSSISSFSRRRPSPREALACLSPTPCSTRSSSPCRLRSCAAITSRRSGRGSG